MAQRPAHPYQRLLDQVELTYAGRGTGPLPGWIAANCILEGPCLRAIERLPEKVPKEMEGAVARQMAVFMTHMEQGRDALAKAIFYAEPESKDDSMTS